MCLCKYRPEAARLIIFEIYCTKHVIESLKTAYVPALWHETLFGRHKVTTEAVLYEKAAIVVGLWIKTF